LLLAVSHENKAPGGSLETAKISGRVRCQRNLGRADRLRWLVGLRTARSTDAATAGSDATACRATACRATACCATACCATACRATACRATASRAAACRATAAATPAGRAAIMVAERRRIAGGADDQ
jgi:hypothetical protein